MSALAASDPQVQSALRECVRTLERVASYRLPPALEQRIQELGENKEFLGTPAHEDLLALVALVRQRSVEKLEADLALQKLRAVLPEALVK